MSDHTVDSVRSELRICAPATRKGKDDKRKAIQRLVEASGELSSNQIADALGVCNQTVDAVRNELGISQAGKRKGADGKQYPAKMKREPRTADANVFGELLLGGVGGKGFIII